MSTDQPDDVRAKRELLQNLLDQGRRQQTETARPAPVAAIYHPPAPEPPAYVPQPVRSQPMPSATRRTPPATTRPNAARDPYDTSVIDHATVDRVAVNAVRLLAYVILAASFFGSVLAFNGNWQPSLSFWHGISPVAAGAGIALQLEITLVEWWRGARWTDPVYLFHLALDTVLTFVGFWPLLGPAFTRTLAVLAAGITGAAPSERTTQIAARILFSVACVLAARLPEKWLVKRPLTAAQEAPAYA